jgi:hypothetical protein
MRTSIIIRASRFRATRVKKPLNLHEQSLGKKALRDETIGAMAATLVGEREPVKFGEDDHAQVRAGEADLLCSLQPVDPRHAEIEEDKVRPPERGEMYRVLAVTGRADDLKAPRKLKILADGAQSGGRIVSDQDPNGIRKGHKQLRS